MFPLKNEFFKRRQRGHLQHRASAELSMEEAICGYLSAKWMSRNLWFSSAIGETITLWCCTHSSCIQGPPLAPLSLSLSVWDVSACSHAHTQQCAQTLTKESAQTLHQHFIPYPPHGLLERKKTEKYNSAPIWWIDVLHPQPSTNSCAAGVEKVKRACMFFPPHRLNLGGNRQKKLELISGDYQTAVDGLTVLQGLHNTQVSS